MGKTLKNHLSSLLEMAYTLCMKEAGHNKHLFFQKHLKTVWNLYEILISSVQW